jgi:hypothetical protein
MHLPADTVPAPASAEEKPGVAQGFDLGDMIIDQVDSTASQQADAYPGGKAQRERDVCIVVVKRWKFPR